MKKTKFKQLKHWQLHVKMVLSSTGINEQEPEAEKRKRIKALEADPEKWFKYYFPKYAFAAPAAFHLAATNRVLQNKEWYEVRLWSRELAKSTRTMMEVLYLVLVGHIPEETQLMSTTMQIKLPVPERQNAEAKQRLKKRYVLLVSNSEDNAIRLLMPYKANLEYNKRIIQDYGLQMSPGNWQMGEFVSLDGVAFRALGAGQSPRGTRNEERRPDIILFDDVDTDADCLNPEIIARKWRWIEEAAIGTRSVSEPTTIIFCGNRISADCCIERAIQMADHKDEINIREEDGNPTWPEKNSNKDIDRVLKQKSYAAQQKEYFNNPITEGSVFEAMAYKPARPLNEYKILVCYTDPSYKCSNDYKATVLVGKWRDEYHVIKSFVALTTTAELINWHYQIMDLVKGCNCYYLIEEVFMQDVIRKEIADAGKRTGRNIPISGDTRKKPEKFMRIESLLEPLHRNGQLYLNENERHNPHMKRLAEQFVSFTPGSRAHDDGPDAVEGAVWKIGDIMGRGGIITFPKTVSENRL